MAIDVKVFALVLAGALYRQGRINYATYNNILKKHAA